MHSIRKNRRAVSPIIATLLLVAIAVAAAILTYSWTMSMARNQGEAAQVSLKIDKVTFSGNETITATIRNTGSVVTTINEAYVYNSTDVSITLESSITATQIGIGKTADITLTLDSAPLESGSAYRLQFWANTGYSVEGVFYSPAT